MVEKEKESVDWLLQWDGKTEHLDFATDHLRRSFCCVCFQKKKGTSQIKKKRSYTVFLMEKASTKIYQV